jgi:hypothetical protein
MLAIKIRDNLRPWALKEALLHQEGSLTHVALFEAFESEAVKLFGPVKDYGIWLSPDTNTLAASLDFPSGLSVAIVNSRNRRLACRLYAGLCFDDAGIPLFQVLVGRHTRKLMNNLNRGLRVVLECAHNASKEFRTIKRGMQEAPMSSNPPGGSLLFQAGQDGLVPWSRIGEAVKGLATLHRYPSTWDLLYQFARASGKSPPPKQLHQTYKFYRLLRTSNCEDIQC